MKKEEFLSTLRSALSVAVSSSSIQSHIEYYNDYIDSEIRMGRSEEDVIKSLGNPRLIAKTIINAQGLNKNSQEYDSYGRQKEEHQEGFGRKKGFHINYDKNGKTEFRFGKFKLNSWYGKLLGILIVLFFIIALFTVLGGIAAILLRFAFPILVIVLLVIMFRNSSSSSRK